MPAGALCVLSKHYQLNHTPKAGKNIRLSSKKYILFKSCAIKKRKKLNKHTLSTWETQIGESKAQNQPGSYHKPVSNNKKQKDYYQHNNRILLFRKKCLMSSKCIPLPPHTHGMDSVSMYPGIASKSKSSYPSLQSVRIMGICQHALQI